MNIIWFLYAEWDLDDDDKERAEGDEDVLEQLETFHMEMKFLSLLFLLLNTGIGVVMFFRLAAQFYT